MKHDSAKQRWERLQNDYRNAVQSTYPNPEGIGCPPSETLRHLAAQSAQHTDIEEDENWKHVAHCGPCYGAYLDYRAACRASMMIATHRGEDHNNE